MLMSNFTHKIYPDLMFISHTLFYSYPYSYQQKNKNVPKPTGNTYFKIHQGVLTDR